MKIIQEIITNANITTAIAGILSTIITIYLTKLIQRFRTEKYNLKLHPIFLGLVESINKVNNWNYKKNRKPFVDALIIKLKVWSKANEDIVEELENVKNNSDILYTTITKWAYQTIDEYTDEWKNNNIPAQVIKRITDEHQKRVELFLTIIKERCYNNDLYPYKKQKIVSILDALWTLLIDTLTDFYKLVYEVEKYNGYFKGVEYQGVPVNDDEYELFLKQLNKTK